MLSKSSTFSVLSPTFFISLPPLPPSLSFSLAYPLNFPQLCLSLSLWNPNNNKLLAARHSRLADKGEIPTTLGSLSLSGTVLQLHGSSSSGRKYASGTAQRHKGLDQTRRFTFMLHVSTNQGFSMLRLLSVGWDVIYWETNPLNSYHCLLNCESCEGSSDVSGFLSHRHSRLASTETLPVPPWIMAHYHRAHKVMRLFHELCGCFKG